MPSSVGINRGIMYNYYVQYQPKVIVIVSILIALDVGTKLAQSYVILPTLSLLSWVFVRLLDLLKESLIFTIRLE